MDQSEVKTCLKPGQKGTKRQVEEYGDRLVCVRYRNNDKTGIRYKTVELIIEETIIEKVANRERNPDQRKPGEVKKVKPTDTFGVKVDYWETDLQKRVKAFGGIWRPHQRLWEMQHKYIVALGLEARMGSRELAAG